MEVSPMPERIACAIECDFGIWPKSVMVASARSTDQLKSPTDLAFRVKASVDDWLKNTPEGRAAYKTSSHDFNAGDLLQRLGEPSLVARLIEQGVDEFTLSAPVQFVGWYYDEQLYEELY
jgi:hypothetical protein